MSERPGPPLLRLVPGGGVATREGPRTGTPALVHPLGNRPPRPVAGPTAVTVPGTVAGARVLPLPRRGPGPGPGSGPGSGPDAA